MDQCNRHEGIEIRVKSIEEKVKELEEEWNTRFEGYKSHFNKKIDKIETDITESTSLYNSLNLTIVKLDGTVTNLIDKLNAFVSEVEDNKKNTKIGLIFPLIVGFATGIGMVIISKYIK